MNTSAKLTIDQGTLSFVIQRESVNFSDNKNVQLLSINPIGGNIIINKNHENQLEIMFVVLGKGSVNLISNVGNLDFNENHVITLTWSLLSGRLVLYINGKIVADSDIVFN